MFCASSVCAEKSKNLQPRLEFPKVLAACALCVVLITVQACTKPQTGTPSNADQPAAPKPVSEAPEIHDPSLLDRIKNEHWTGDIEGMRGRRYIRALVLYNRTNFFYDGPQPRGITYEALKEFEKFLNTKLNTGDKPVHMVFIPVSREDGIRRMQDGRGDIAASNIAIIPELQEFVDFSDPVREGAKEVIVSGRTVPQIASIDDLSGKEIFVRRVSRYWANLERLNQRFKESGRSQMANSTWSKVVLMNHSPILRISSAALCVSPRSLR